MPVALISGLCLIEGWTPTEIPICYIPAYPFVWYWLLDFDLAEMFCSYNRPVGDNSPCPPSGETQGNTGQMFPKKLGTFPNCGGLLGESL